MRLKKKRKKIKVKFRDSGGVRNPGLRAACHSAAARTVVKRQRRRPRRGLAGAARRARAARSRTYATPAISRRVVDIDPHQALHGTQRAASVPSPSQTSILRTRRNQADRSRRIATRVIGSSWF